MVFASASASDITITLPNAADVTEELTMIKKVFGVHKVIVTAQGTDSIDGAATLEITELMAAFTLFSDGVTWHVM